MTTTDFTEAIRELRLPPPQIRQLLRQRTGLSTADLGREIGVTATSVWRWEAGQREPRGEHRRQYAGFLAAAMDVAKEDLGAGP